MLAVDVAGWNKVVLLLLPTERVDLVMCLWIRDVYANLNIILMMDVGT